MFSRRVLGTLLGLGLALPLVGCGAGARIRTLEQDIGELKVRLSNMEGTLGRHEETMRDMAEAKLDPAPLIQPAAYAPPPPPRRRAPNKPRVRDIQACLKSAGFSPGRIDGKMGPRTKSAIRKFQKANRIKVDAVVGGRTWGKLKWYY